MAIFKRREKPVEEPKPYWQQRSWRMSAGFLGIVVVAGAATALTSGGDTVKSADDSRPQESAAVAKGPLSGPLVDNGRPRDCHTDDSGGSTVPKSAPKDVVWRSLGAAQVPVSSSAGPKQREGTPWWCFAHTPMGAVEAAVIIPSQASGSGWRQVSREQLVAGSGRDQFEKDREYESDIDGPDDVDAGSLGYYAGFAVLSYQDEAATVKLLIKSDVGGLTGTTTVHLRWDRGDWKVQPSGGGELFSAIDYTANTNGFIMWGD
ncbi:hypothetical protein [Streptomyces sp. NPDC050560]|uniref:hypothetical protein n=1 Tax=Streptomyces sp. NPDC050560 TaxID=3365630 RepID=UPI0037B63336